MIVDDVVGNIEHPKQKKGKINNPTLKSQTPSEILNTKISWTHWKSKGVPGLVIFSQIIENNPLTLPFLFFFFAMVVDYLFFSTLDQHAVDRGCPSFLFALSTTTSSSSSSSSPEVVTNDVDVFLIFIFSFSLIYLLLTLHHNKQQQQQLQRHN